ncbi:hypothetical protein [Pseudonocardia sp. GCM10023141]|uniref:SbtR family transcriptional regulator n=1 Tax=Pseudonocardia sp. GCM10023141 TaxID=3252653 RepID=UPI00361C1C3B
MCPPIAGRLDPAARTLGAIVMRSSSPRGSCSTSTVSRSPSTTSPDATKLTAATRLLDRAHGATAVRPGLTAVDLLALVSGIALTGLPEPRLDGLLGLVRDGYGAPVRHHGP